LDDFPVILLLFGLKENSFFFKIFSIPFLSTII
jgi:hypothetical protein